MLYSENSFGNHNGSMAKISSEMIGVGAALMILSRFTSPVTGIGSGCVCEILTRFMRSESGKLAKTRERESHPKTFGDDHEEQE